MPINYAQLREQITNAGKVLSDRRQDRQKKQEEMLHQFESICSQGDLTERLNNALLNSPNERCAMPGTEAPGSSFPEPDLPRGYARVFASDGSQINPSRHDEISFGMINTAVVMFIACSGRAPRIITDTQLLDFSAQLSEDEVALRRDVAEKQALARLAENITDKIPSFAISDGSLELFTDSNDFPTKNQLIRDYREALRVMAERKVPAVGYIDRPRSNPVIRMLELVSENVKNDADDPLFDSDLFTKILGPGERSAIFQMNSKSNQELPDDMKLCFFYLNVGRSAHPALSRVELPAWAAADPGLVDCLHINLMDQIRVLSDHPYPYVLHRAHECAVISFEEKERITGLLLRELIANGVPVGEKSNKQFAKDLMKSN